MTDIQTQNIPALRFPEFSGEWDKQPLVKLVKRIIKPVHVKLNEMYTQIGVRSHGKGLFHKEPVTGKSLGKKRVFWIYPNLFVVNIVFGWEQAVAKTTEKEIGMIASHRFPMYEPRKAKLDLDFLLTFFLTKKGKYLLGLASPGGAGRNKTLGQKEFEKLQITLPSVSEQRKLAAFVGVVDEKVGQLIEKKALLEAYKKGIMQQLFTQKIRFCNDNGNHFPDWEVKKLGELGRYLNGLSGKTSDDFGKGKPFITYKQIFDNSKVDVSRFQFVDIHKNENQHCMQYGDIFFTTSSETPKEVGFSSVLLDHIDEVYLNSFCFAFRPESFKILNPIFAQFLFRNEGFRKEVIKLAQGSTRYNISKIGMMKISLLLPCEKEQQIIANFLTEVDKKIAALTAQLTHAQNFKKGLLLQIFV